MIKILFNREQVKRVKNAVQSVANTVRRTKERFGYYCANDYVELLRKNMLSQKFAARYDAYSPRYKKWKDKYYGDKGYWLLTKTLYNIVGTYRGQKPGDWIGGLPPNMGTTRRVMGSQKRRRTQVSVNVYAHANEYGIGVPARPIFKPTKEEYENGQFIQRIKQFKNEIRKRWH